MSGCATSASSVPVSCSSLTLFPMPSDVAWITTVTAMPTSANAKYEGASPSGAVVAPSKVSEMK